MIRGQRITSTETITGIPVKKDDKKTKAFYDWATTGIPVKILKNTTLYRYNVSHTGHGLLIRRKRAEK